LIQTVSIWILWTNKVDYAVRCDYKANGLQNAFALQRRKNRGFRFIQKNEKPKRDLNQKSNGSSDRRGEIFNVLVRGACEGKWEEELALVITERLREKTTRWRPDYN